VNGHPLRLIPGAALTAILASGLLLPERTAAAAEPEQVAVRNRYYRDDAKIEVMFMTGLSVANTLTSMYTPAFNLAYHIDENWAIELILGYAVGGVTSLQAGAQAPIPATGSGGTTQSVFYKAYVPPNTNRAYKDLPNLWTINGFNAQLGARWEPVYGKLSLLTTVPIHFKWYLDADAGIGQFTRNSLYYCNSYNQPGITGGSAEDCTKNADGTYHTVQGSRWGFVGSVGTGMRFIFLKQASLLLGLREYFWYDTYQTDFHGSDFVNNPGGNGGTKQTGVTFTLFADFGLSWTF